MDTHGLPLLRAHDVHKHYGGVHALRGASLEVAAGEVHGLIGANGSGKSTLLKILSGQTLPDQATVTLAGTPLPLGHATRSLAAGIATVAQETTLVPDLTVTENILLGRRTVRRWYGLDWPATRERAREILDRLELRIDPRAIVGRLRPDEQQMVEIARAISMDARVLILDEPTSSLPDEEVASLFAVVRNLTRHGVATIFVSHRMREVFDLTDRVTVLRDGCTVARRDTAEIDAAELIQLMVGKELDRVQHEDRPARPATAGPGLRVRDLGVPGLLRDVSLDVAPGEIVGLAGLVGAGRSELLKALFGLHPATTGTIELDGRPIVNRGPTDAIGNGLAYVPPDRLGLGLVPYMSSRENLMMARSAGAWRARRPPRALEARLMRETISDFQVAGPAANGSPVSSLSGGNQQKVVLAKWMGVRPKAMLLDEPTRGVDVGAKAQIYGLLDRLRADGLAILVSSSETPELLLLCDRVLVMFRGAIVAALPRHEATEARVAHYATGHG